MTKLPKLSEAIQRKLDLQHRALIRFHGLTEERLRRPDPRRADGELRTGVLLASHEVAVGDALVTRTTLLAIRAV